MSKKTWLGSLTGAALTVCLLSVSALAQQRDSQERAMTCNDNWNDRPSHCEIKEQTLAATGGVINVDGGKNGGVSVKGWERAEIFVRARIQTHGESDAEAKDLATQIRIETGGAQIRAEGPSTRDRQNWSVSFEVFVPRHSNLSLKTVNGGIGISDVRGRIEFTALNGGVSLKRLAGSVQGQTTNGGLSVDLAGDRWDGEGLDVKTTNGGVTLLVPENYSARLETGTVNGGLNLGFPVTAQGRLNKELSVDLGSGGATLRVVTTNGGVSLKRKS
jgi:DUF4097 and DUF4098 domain-containing protein YvlB